MAEVKQNPNVDYGKVRERAEYYQEDMTAFLRALIKAYGESTGEEERVKLIKAEMEKLDYNRTEVDELGNIIGYMGEGDKLIGLDAHIDTVGIGNISNWDFDPVEGYEDDVHIGGRGSSDQLGGMVSAVYGAKIAADLDLIPEGYAFMVVGSVQEEDCDGMCWEYIIKENDIRPEFVVSTEPTDSGIYRGQRGRMEIRVEVEGVSCHGSAPERGDNALYKIAEILLDVEKLNENDASEENEIKGLVKMLEPEYNDQWEEARFLGRGTVTASEIFFTSPSRCAVADSAAISLDRRMTAGETWEYCLEEIRNLPAAKKHNAKVSLYEYARPSWTGYTYPIESYFPTWVIPADHPVTTAMEEVYINLYGDQRQGAEDTIEERQARPLTDKWTFSTNGVSIMGRNGIPVIGFGPGAEAQAHAPNEVNWKQDLVQAASIYAPLAQVYADNKAE